MRAIWYGTTVCTNSFACKVSILQARNLSCDDPLTGLEYALHDFGARGVSSAESAEIGGAAHLVNFKGSDTFECLRPIRNIYHERMAAHSVVAAEHSTIISWRRGQQTHEVDAYDNMLTQFAKERGGIIAVVSDSYDLWHAIQHIWGGSLRQKIIDSGCTIVVRPDSGNPLIVPVKAVEMLAELFGFSVNRKGYKVLAPCIRIIQGDGINRHSISQILANLLAAGFSAENLVFGMGGALLQMVNRDTMEWAMKASAIEDQDGWRDISKSPVDQPMKQSLAGRFALINDTGKFTDYETVPHGNADDLLATAWENGQTWMNDQFSDIRHRAQEAACAMAI
jgi:nicotinamide phosphoribosyltransferase